LPCYFTAIFVALIVGTELDALLDEPVDENLHRVEAIIDLRREHTQPEIAHHDATYRIALVAALHYLSTIEINHYDWGKP
jgi:hypothetical protein